MFAQLAAAAVLAVLAPVWHLSGRAAQRLQLPAITGMILAGVASGPQALGLLSPAGLLGVAPVQHLCLSLIALSAGAELHLPELRRLRKQVACITAGVSLCSWLLVYCVMRLLAGSIPFMRPLAPSDAAAVCTLAATLAVARSPASAIAVLKETEGKGPYCSLVMAVVVVKDVLLFAAFAVNVELFKAVGKSADTGMPLWLLVGPLVSILLSVVLGGVAGYVLSRLLRMRHGSIISIAAAAVGPHSSGDGHGAAAPHAAATPRGGGLLRLLRHPSALRLRPAVPLLLSGLTFGLAELGGAEPLLACVAAGLVASNWRGESQQGRETAELLAVDLARLAPLINALFFGLVGASLKLAAVRDTLWAAAIIYFVRLGGIWLGCWLGAGAGGTSAETSQHLWMGMVTQAGIALGLAQAVAARFPLWGPDFAALLAGMVVMNLLTGPPLFKAAVVSAGEARASSLPTAHTELTKRGSVKLARDEGGDPRRGGSLSPAAAAVAGGARVPLPTIPILNAVVPAASRS
ncbi:hypothetical protein ACK3TF_002671 [Chlorella vulgaris]